MKNIERKKVKNRDTNFLYMNAYDLITKGLSNQEAKGKQFRKLTFVAFKMAFERGDINYLLVA